MIAFAIFLALFLAVPTIAIWHIDKVGLVSDGPMRRATGTTAVPEADTLPG